MVTPELVNFIKSQIASGIPKEQITNSLLQSGWLEADIVEAFATALNQKNDGLPQINRANKISLRYIIISLIVLILIAGSIAGFFFFRKNSVSQQNPVSQGDNLLSENNQTEDLKIDYVAVPADENSADIFNTIGVDAISSEDINFLNKYFADYSSANSPSLVEAKKVLAKYKNVLVIFESGITKKYYQCSYEIFKCVFNPTIMRNVSRLAALNAFVLFKDGKIDEARAYAAGVVKFGQMLRAQADSMLFLSAGSAIQKLGYNMTTVVAKNFSLSDSEKKSLISNLRDEHKRVFKLMYTNFIETVDYITDPNKEPPRMHPDLVNDWKVNINKYRTASNNINWKPDVVKKWFYDAAKISLSNVDLPCGNEPKESTIDVGFIMDGDEMITDNSLGKALYATSYAPFEDSHKKRCELETYIMSL